LTTNVCSILYMNTKLGHHIKQIQSNDIYYTPIELAKFAISLIPNSETHQKWLDPCYGTGNYYTQFPSDKCKDYCEITEDKDFFQYESKVDVICSNPPYSILDQWLSHAQCRVGANCNKLLDRHKQFDT
jgi:type I restriction-modification system DNA methylase subunit